MNIISRNSLYPNYNPDLQKLSIQESLDNNISTQRLSSIVYDKGSYLSKPKTSSQRNGVAHAFAVNSYKGRTTTFLKDEDRVTIFFDMVKVQTKDKLNPDNINTKNSPFSFFGLYQGFNGNGCASYLRDNLHKFILNSKYFPNNIHKSIKEACIKADYEFIRQALTKTPEADMSGSSAVIFLA